MKFYCDLPWGGHLHIEREPMAAEKFYALVALAGGALLVALFLGGAMIR